MQHVAMDKLKGKQVIKSRYDNFIGGKWVAPVKGEYFDVITPITGKPYTQAARSGAEDVGNRGTRQCHKIPSAR